MTVSPSRFIPSLKKGDTIERRDLETAILASSFYFHFVNEIYYYYYYYYRCNPPSIKRAKSLSGRLIVPGKRKREKRKKRLAEISLANEEIFSLLHRLSNVRTKK